MEMCRYASIDDPEYLKVISALRYVMDKHSKHRETRDFLSPVTDWKANGPALADHSIDITCPTSVKDLQFNDSVSTATEMIDTVHSPSSDNEFSAGLSRQTYHHRLSQEQRQQLVESLAFHEIDARRANLRDPKSNTCRWILDSPQYKEWKDRQKLADHHGFLWIKGKPGAGKSIMMKYLYSKARATIRGAKVISFFFNARGAQLEHSTSGLYRSLLFQLLEGDVALQESFDVLGYHASRLTGDIEWRPAALKNVLAKAIEMLGGRALVCYIDALDECPIDEIRDMVSFFEDSGERAVAFGVRFNICFSSRHYPHITIKKGLSLTLEKEDSHTTDIQKYIDSELRIDQPRQAAEIKDKIIAKASGVFLWVALVIPLLNEAFDSGKIKELRRKLDELPPELSDLFQELLLRDSNDRPALLLCFQWVLFSKAPMKLEELHFAVQDVSDDEDALTWNMEEFPREAMAKSLLSISKGLVEETRAKHPTMQFIHESVRDFLLKENGLQKIWPDLGDDFEGQSHCCLADRCVQYIQTTCTRKICPDQLPQSAVLSKELRVKTTLSHPFLEYAINNVLYHSDAAQCLGVTQSGFLEQFPLTTWLVGYNLVVQQVVRRYPENISMLYVLAEQDLVHLVRIHPNRMRHLDIEGGRYRTPLLAALACGNLKVSQDLGLQVFLDQNLLTNENGQFDNFYKSLKPQRDFDPWKLTLLTSLTRFACVSAIKALFLREFNVDEVDKSGQTALVSSLLDASSNGHTAIVAILLENGADVNAQGGPYGNALQTASSHGHTDIVAILLEKGADVNAQGGLYGNAIHIAIYHNCTDIVAILLEKGADVNAQGGPYGNALQTASSHGHTDIVAILLEKGADVNAQGGPYGNALQTAIYHNCTDIVAILLEKGADVNAQGGPYDNAIHTAIYHNCTDIVAILLEKGANVNAQGGPYGNALCGASYCGRTDIVVMLLEKGADINAQGGPYGNALQTASYHGHTDIVVILLEKGADVNAQGGPYGNALQAASSQSSQDHDMILQALLENGADVNA
jgi:ankyrin repeat protein